MRCLSVHQPWAWFIVEGWKPIENRNWPLPKDMINRNCLIHAAKTLTVKEYDEACTFALRAGATITPNYDRLKRGGIVGMVRFTRCVTQSPSKWFVGKFGFVIRDPYPLPFIPCAGQLGFYEYGSLPRRPDLSPGLTEASF